MTATMSRVTDEELQTAAREAAATLLALTERTPHATDSCPTCGAAPSRHESVLPRRRNAGQSFTMSSRVLRCRRWPIPQRPTQARGPSSPGAGARRSPAIRLRGGRL